MKCIKFFVLLFIITLYFTPIIFCMEEVQLEACTKKSVGHKTISIATYNSGAQSSMEAGSYWAARSLLAENSKSLQHENKSQEEDKVETKTICCGFFTLFAFAKLRSH